MALAVFSTFSQLKLMRPDLICHPLSPNPSVICKLVSALLFFLLLNRKETHAIGVTVGHGRPRQGEHVFQVLKKAGYNLLATALQDANVPLPPLHDATFFAPTDGALSSIVLTSATIMDVLDLQVVIKRLAFEDLLHLPLGSMLHTFHPDIELAVTRVSNATHRFAISGVSVADPDIYNDNTLAIHGVESLFRPIGSGLNSSSGDPGTLLETKASESSSGSKESVTSASIFTRHRNLQSAVRGDQQELYYQGRNPWRTYHGKKKNTSDCYKKKHKYYSRCDQSSSATGKMSLLTLRWLLDKGRRLV